MTENEKTDEQPDETGKRLELALLQLPTRRRRFVEEYLVDLNATQGAIRAGYSKKGAHTEGYRLLRNAQVAEAVRLGLLSLSETSHLSASWVREALKQNVRRAWDKGDVQASNRALQILGLSLGMFGDDLNVNVNTVEGAKVVMYFPDNGRGPNKQPEGKTENVDSKKKG